jgi:hypothetical protein
MIMKVQTRRRQYRASITGPGKTSYQRKYDKAMSGSDPQAAIAAKCLDCMYWQRGRITECPIVCCPLWPYRPFTSEKMLEASETSRKPGKRKVKPSSAARAPRAKASVRRRK